MDGWEWAILVDIIVLGFAGLALVADLYGWVVDRAIEKKRRRG